MELVQNSNVTHIFKYGSKVYCTNHYNSDDDYVIITKEKQNIFDDNISQYTFDEFVKGAENCNIACLESYFISYGSSNILKIRFYITIYRY